MINHEYRMLVVSVPALDSKLLTSIRKGERSHSNTRQLTTGRFKAVGKWNYYATDECSYWIDLRILRPSCLPTLDYVTGGGHWQLYTRGARECVAERGESSLVGAGRCAVCLRTNSYGPPARWPVRRRGSSNIFRGSPFSVSPRKP
jgi:hypothetical protein